MCRGDAIAIGSYGDCRAVAPRKCQYFTVLREPIARRVSEYDWFCRAWSAARDFPPWWRRLAACKTLASREESRRDPPTGLSKANLLPTAWVVRLGRRLDGARVAAPGESNAWTDESYIYLTTST